MVTFVLLGFNLTIAVIVTFTVAIIIVDLLGLMYIWDISLNAVSLVNLVMVRSFLCVRRKMFQKHELQKSFSSFSELFKFSKQLDFNFPW